MLPIRLRAILRRQPFSRVQSCTQISRPSRVHSFYNFRARPLPIIVILTRRQPFSSCLSRTLISRPSQERSNYKFRAQPHLIIVIWPKYPTRVISRDIETKTFFELLIVQAYISALPGARPLQIFILWSIYATRAMSGNFERATFFVHANIPTLPGALLL